MLTVARSRGKFIYADLLHWAGVTEKHRKSGGLCILVLHKVNNDPDPLPLTLSIALFREMLGEITRNHEVVRLSDMTEPAQLSADELKFAITFDDGYRDNYESAYPILKEFGIPATIYLSVDHMEGKLRFWYERLIQMIQNASVDSLVAMELGLGELPLGSEENRKVALFRLNQALKELSRVSRDEILDLLEQRLAPMQAGEGSAMLSWDMVREMSDHGIDIGAHTMTHPILSRERKEVIAYEVAESKRYIESKIDKTVTSFTYPNGGLDDFNNYVIEQIRQSGYRHATTTIPGVNDKHTDPYLWKRFNVHNGMCAKPGGRFSASLFWAKAFALL